MSNTFESIPVAEQKVADLPTQPPRDVQAAKGAAPAPLEAKLNAFYQTVCVLLPESPSRCLQFISSRSGERASPLLRQFARHIAERIGRPVLLIDFEPGLARGARRASPKPAGKAAKKVATSPNGLPEGVLSINPVDNSTLFLAHVEHPDTLLGLTTDPRNWSELLARLRQQFELILLDAPPLSDWPDGLSLAGAVDGVVLIIEAEATRWQVAQRAREEILRHGGKLLGVILNKRRFYIPDFIYKWL